MLDIYESVNPDSVILQLHENEITIAQLPADQKFIVTNKDLNFKEQVID